MTAPFSSRPKMRQALRRVLVLSLPLAVNVLVWRGLVAPSQHRRDTLRQALMATEIKPALESALVQSHETLAAWQATTFTASDPAAVMQTLQRLAGRHGVQIKTLEGGSQQMEAAATMPLDLEVTGRFNRLARWLSDVERCAGLQVESWTIAPGVESGQPHELTIKLTAQLGAA